MGKRTVLAGVGKIGCGAVDALMQRYCPGEEVFPMLFAAGETELGERTTEPDFVFSRVCSLESVVKAGDLLKAWRPRDERADRSLQLKSGSAAWSYELPASSRNLAAMMFAGFCAFGGREQLDAEIDRIADGYDGNGGGDECTVYMVASLFDGTGSGVFLPLSLYIARALHERGVKAKFRALLVTPRDMDSYGNEITKTAPHVNFHKALYELNEVMSGCTEGEFFLGTPDDGVTGQLYPMDTEWAADAGLFGRVYFANRQHSSGNFENMLADELWALMSGVFDGVVQDSKDGRCCFLATSAVEFPVWSAAEYISGQIALDREKKWFGMDVQTDEQDADRTLLQSTPTAKAAPVWVDEYLDLVEARARGGHEGSRDNENGDGFGLLSDEAAQLLGGDLCHRPLDGRKKKQDKQARLAELAEQCRGKLKAFSEELGARFADDVIAVRDSFLSYDNESEGKSRDTVALADVLQLEAWDFPASLGRLELLMSGVEKRLGSMKPGSLALVRGESTKAYLTRVTELPLPDALKAPEWETAVSGGANKKCCEALAGLLKDAGSAVSEAWEGRRAAAAIVLLGAALDRMKTAFERLISEGRSMVEDREREHAGLLEARKNSGWDTTYVGIDSGSISEMCKAARQELSGLATDRSITAIAALLCEAGDLEHLPPLSGELNTVLCRGAADESRQLYNAWLESETWREVRRGGIVAMAGDARQVAEAVSMAECRAQPRVEMYTKPGSPERLRYASFALFSPETAEYIARISGPEDGGDCADVKAALETFMQLGGCSESGALVSDGMAPERIVCVSCVDSIRMSAMTDISETSVNAAWYHRYLRLSERFEECDLWTAFGYAVFSGKRGDPPGFEPKTGSKEKLC